MSDYLRNYTVKLQSLIAAHGEERAMELFVGGQYHQQGLLEKDLLLALGLQRTHDIVDVGCGSGRLAFALREYLQGRYVGTDIVAPALAYARQKVRRPDWRFVETSEPVIPALDYSADFVCFFSVFTHLLDEDCYRFLQEAKRVAKPDRLIVFSFLDFEVSWHWPVFESHLADRDPQRVLNRFHSKSAFRIWAGMLGLTVEKMIDGPEPWIPLTDPIMFEHGRTVTGMAEFGQSVCVLRTPCFPAGTDQPAPTIAQVATSLGFKHWSA